MTSELRVANLDDDYRLPTHEIPKVIASYTGLAQTFAEFFTIYECDVELTKYNSILTQRDEHLAKHPTMGEGVLDLQLRNIEEQLHRFKWKGKKYLNTLQNISNGYQDSFTFESQNYVDYIRNRTANEEGSQKVDALIQLILKNTMRAIKLITIAAENIRKQECVADDHGMPLSASKAAILAADSTYKLQLWHSAPFEVFIVPPDSLKMSGIRDIVDNRIGQFMKMDASVAKIETARPRMKVARYICTHCHADGFQPIDGDEYLPARSCGSEECQRVNKISELQLIKRESRMVSHEVVVIQEPQYLCPPGAVPRRLKVIMEGSLCSQLKPGNSITISGVPLPIEHSGFGGMARSNVRDIQFIAQHFKIHKTSKYLDEKQKSELHEFIMKERGRTDWYEWLANSLCPTIYGHLDVKKALLLQLVGAPSLKTSKGLSVRGEIHCLLMGDPGVAKSQMLSKIVRVAPRASYTTGKGASGVGLTASVTKDPATGEFTLEGGAIVLADRGICCIDEFDKMDESDRTSIHEVMEQQTVSISKAGLNMQLNARTAILAAANPVYGRYDTTKSVIDNMRLPYSLISRFDLAFVILDKVDADVDWALAKFILTVHEKSSKAVDDAESEWMDSTCIRYVLQYAQTIDPEIPTNVANEIQNRYLELRDEERFTKQTGGSEDTYTTPRTLFSIIRLSQAVARVRFSKIVSLSDVAEACRLMASSRASLKVSDKKKNRADGDEMTRIIDLMRVMDRENGDNPFMPIAAIKARCEQNGFTGQSVNKTISNYVSYGVLTFESDDKHAVAFQDRVYARRTQTQ